MSWNMDINRRQFLAAGLAAGVASSSAITSVAGAVTQKPGPPAQEHTSSRNGRFRRIYAPHFGMFRHHAGDDLIDQIRFMADEGFLALEDNGLIHRPIAVQERIGSELDRHGMRLGLFIGSSDFGNPTFASGREDFRRAILRDVRLAIETARRVNAHCFTIVPGRKDPRLPFAIQESNAIETLRYCADLCEAAGMMMLLEPLNHGGRSPQMFLHDTLQGARICRSVGEHVCRVLYDVYQLHAVRTDLVRDISRNWSEIGYFQLGDNPGRKEPGTGSIDYRRLFELTDRLGYSGIFGMEHGNASPGHDGERAVIEAYASLDKIAQA